MSLDQTDGKNRESKACQRCRDEGRAIVCLEPALHFHRDDFSAYDGGKSFRPQHDAFVLDEFFGRLGRAMTLDIVGTCYPFRKDRTDKFCDETGIPQNADADCAVVALADKVDDVVTVARGDMKLGMLARHVRQDWREMGRTERKWRGNAQPTTKFAFRR